MTQTTLDTRTVQIAGRDIAVTRIGETQAVLIARESVILQKEGVTFDRLTAGINRVLTTVESLIVSDSDREWVTDQMFAGGIELNDLLVVIRAFRDDTSSTTPAKPAVRRGRPPKASRD